jgi:hypothetical protein
MVNGLKFFRNNKKNQIYNSFIQLSTSGDMDLNSAFDDELATEDKFDSNIKVKKPLTDYNNEVQINSDELTEKVKDDLRGEDVNYRYD